MQANPSDTTSSEETEAEAARHPRPTHVELLREELREAEAEIERLRLEAAQPTKAQRETAEYLYAVLGERQPDGVVSACRGEQEFFIRPDGTLESGITHLAVNEFDGLPHHVRGTGIRQAPPSGDDELTTVIDRGKPEETFAIPPNPDPLVLAREIKRINAFGGRRDKDETARLLYNAADVCHDWDKAKRGGGAEVRMNEARAMARLVDGWIDEMFPSQEACDAAERMGE